MKKSSRFRRSKPSRLFSQEVQRATGHHENGEDRRHLVLPDLGLFGGSPIAGFIEWTISYENLNDLGLAPNLGTDSV